MEKAAIYPGTFDPMTLGHMDIIVRGSRMFDRLIVAIAVNQEKTPLFDKNQRLQLLQASLAHLPGVEVDSFEGLLIDYAQQKNIFVVLRGLRAISDFEIEFQMAAMNHKLSPSLETVFLMAGESTTFLSSRLVREVASMGGEVADFVPPAVLHELNALFGPKKKKGASV